MITSYFKVKKSDAAKEGKKVSSPVGRTGTKHKLSSDNTGDDDHVDDNNII